MPIDVCVCPCCLDSIEHTNRVILTCGHMIHTSCMIDWSIHTKGGIQSCAMCRTPVAPNIRKAADTYSNCKDMALDMLTVFVDNTVSYRFDSVKSLIEFVTIYKQKQTKNEDFNEPIIGSYKFIEINHMHQVFEYLFQKIKEFKYEWRTATDAQSKCFLNLGSKSL